MNFAEDIALKCSATLDACGANESAEQRAQRYEAALRSIGMYADLESQAHGNVAVRTDDEWAEKVGACQHA